MEERVNDKNDDEKEKTAENKNEYLIHIDITENEPETNHGAINRVIKILG